MSDDNEKMRQLFEGAIAVQQGIIEDAERAINHYRYAISEMAKQDEAQYANLKVVS